MGNNTDISGGENIEDREQKRKELEKLKSIKDKFQRNLEREKGNLEYEKNRILPTPKKFVISSLFKFENVSFESPLSDPSISERMNYGIFPLYVQHKIYLFCDLPELLSVSLTCSVFHHLLNFDIFWKDYYECFYDEEKGKIRHVINPLETELKVSLRNEIIARIKKENKDDISLVNELSSPKSVVEIEKLNWKELFYLRFRYDYSPLPFKRVGKSNKKTPKANQPTLANFRFFGLKDFSRINDLFRKLIGDDTAPIPQKDLESIKVRVSYESEEGIHDTNMSPKRNVVIMDVCLSRIERDISTLQSQYRLDEDKHSYEKNGGYLVCFSFDSKDSFDSSVDGIKQHPLEFKIDDNYKSSSFREQKNYCVQRRGIRKWWLTNMIFVGIGSEIPEEEREVKREHVLNFFREKREEDRKRIIDEYFLREEDKKDYERELKALKMNINETEGGDYFQYLVHNEYDNIFSEGTVFDAIEEINKPKMFHYIEVNINDPQSVRKCLGTIIAKFYVSHNDSSLSLMKMYEDQITYNMAKLKEFREVISEKEKQLK